MGKNLPQENYTEGGWMDPKHSKCGLPLLASESSGVPVKNRFLTVNVLNATKLYT